MHYTEFIIVWTLSVVISLAFMLYPVFQNRALKKATRRFSKQLQQNPALGGEFALTLYRPVDRMSVKDGLESNELTTRLTSLPGQAGGFLIYYKQWVDPDVFVNANRVGGKQLKRPFLRPINPFSFSGRVEVLLNVYDSFFGRGQANLCQPASGEGTIKST